MFGQHNKREHHYNSLLYSKKFSPTLVARDMGVVSTYSKQLSHTSPYFCAATDGAASLFIVDINHEAVKFKIPEYHQSWVNNMEFSPSNLTLFSASTDNCINSCDICTEKVHSVDLGLIPDGLCSMSDHELFYTASDFTCNLYDLRDRSQTTIAPLGNLAFDLKVIGDSILFVADADGVIWWWDLRMRKPLTMMNSSSIVTSLDYQNHCMLMNSRDSLWFLPNVDMVAPIKQDLCDYPGVIELDVNYNTLNSKNGSLSKDARYALVGWDRDFAVVWDIENKKSMTSVKTPKNSSIFKTHFLDNGMISVTYESSIVFYGMGNEPIRKVVDKDDEIYAEETTEFNDISVIFDEEDREDAECTYEQGYIDQDVFICLTCRQTRPNLAGFCKGCAIACHDQHNIVKIDIKRSFRCDCGNSNFGDKCTLCPDKEKVNENNQYNQNFEGKYCYCHGPVRLPMMMCFGCCDWFHANCVDKRIDEDELEINSLEYICEMCKDKVMRPDREIYENLKPILGVLMVKRSNLQTAIKEINELRNNPVGGMVKDAIEQMMDEMMRTTGHVDVPSLVREALRVFQNHERDDRDQSKQ